MLHSTEPTYPGPQARCAGIVNAKMFGTPLDYEILLIDSVPMILTVSIERSSARRQSMCPEFSKLAKELADEQQHEIEKPLNEAGEYRVRANYYGRQLTLYCTSSKNSAL